MNSTTRQAVYDLLKSFAQQSVKRYGPQDIEELKQAHPFHKLFLNDAGLIAAKRERSAVTRMGMFLFPRLAKSIASERYQQVILEHKMQGLIAKPVFDIEQMFPYNSLWSLANRTQPVGTVLFSLKRSTRRLVASA